MRAIIFNRFTKEQIEIKKFKSKKHYLAYKAMWIITRIVRVAENGV